MSAAPEIAYSLEEGQDLLSHVIARAEQYIDIYSDKLDPAFYNQESISDQLMDFVLENHHKRIRILIQDPKQATQGGHHLLELGKRLSSYIHMRRPIKPHRRKTDPQFLLADNTHVFYREFSDSYKTQAYIDNPPIAQPLAQQFQQQWELAESHPDLRYFS